jgi:hypothetical protein
LPLTSSRAKRNNVVNKFRNSVIMGCITLSPSFLQFNAAESYKADVGM